MVLRTAGLSDEYYFTKTGRSLTKLVDLDGRAIKARRLNNKGQILGTVDTNLVLWQDGKTDVICEGYPAGLNDHGDIAGVHDGRAFLIKSGERIDGPKGSHLSSINNAGIAVGEAADGQPATWDGLVWNYLNKAEGYETTVAWLINNEGLICGYCENDPPGHLDEEVEEDFAEDFAFWTHRQLVVWIGAEAHVLARSHPIVCPMDLNDRGDIVGYFEDWDIMLPITANHGFIHSEGRFLDFDGLDGEYSFYQGVWLINNARTVLATQHDTTVVLKATRRALRKAKLRRFLLDAVLACFFLRVDDKYRDAMSPGIPPKREKHDL